MRKISTSSLFSLLFAASLFTIANGSSSSRSVAGASVVSPVKHLEASVAASSAHTSVAAVRCVSQADNQECVLVVTFKPFASNAQQSPPHFEPKADADIPQSSRRRTQEMFGLRLLDQELQTLPPPSSRWTLLGGGAMCVMTGFVPDVQHLTRVVLNQVESHQMIYSHAMSVDRIVRYLASFVQRAARTTGARPFGVQALIVGLVNNSFQLYTVDPTGGWQQYGRGATAIGRGAANVRAEIYKALQDTTVTTDFNASEALTMIVSSLIGKAVKEGTDDDYTNRMEAVLVWKAKSGSCCVSRIDDSEIQKCLKRILE